VAERVAIRTCSNVFSASELITLLRSATGQCFGKDLTAIRHFVSSAKMKGIADWEVIDEDDKK